MAEGKKRGFSVTPLTVVVAAVLAFAAAVALYLVIDSALAQHTEDLLEDGEARMRNQVTSRDARYDELGRSTGGAITAATDLTQQKFHNYATYIRQTEAGAIAFESLLYAPRVDGEDGRTRYEITHSSPPESAAGLTGVDLSSDLRFAAAFALSVASRSYTLSDPFLSATGTPVTFGFYPIIPPGTDGPTGVLLFRQQANTGQIAVTRMYDMDENVFGVRIESHFIAPDESFISENDAHALYAGDPSALRRSFSFLFANRVYDVDFVAPRGMAIPRRDRVLQYTVVIGAFISLFGAMTTLTALYRGRKELAREVELVSKAKKAVDEFASLASHQLKAPLTAMKWSTEVLQDPGTGSVNDRQRGLLEEIADSIKRMNSLVNKLLSASRVESGTFSAVPEPTDVAKLVHAYVADNAPAAASRQLAVTEDYAKDLPSVDLDPQLAGSIIQNLLSNAIRYTKPGGKVTVRAWQENGRINVAVTDTGIGIPKEALGPLWDKGFRTKEAAVMEAGGTGLGLYLV
ncbi:MAG TPA: HAMP domain-containing sensor histidine kinase, partial [Candidatus Paceibacterota bacterium]|nr:HAMP domain-containing sensor histidine kinase [Candidatus Paceibacterota bacterium]